MAKKLSEISQHGLLLRQAYMAHMKATSKLVEVGLRGYDDVSSS
jgi:hypothetical protein